MHISLPQPCSENPAGMAAVPGGRYCDHCAQVVTDFTRMTDAQLIDWIRQGKRGCGSFRPDQLNRQLIAPEVRNAPFGLRWLLGLLVAAGCIAEESKPKARRPATPVEQRIANPGPGLGEPVPEAPDSTRQKAAKHAKQKERRAVEPEPIMGDVIVTAGIPAWPEEPQAAADTPARRFSPDSAAATQPGAAASGTSRPSFWQRCFGRRGAK